MRVAILLLGLGLGLALISAIAQTNPPTDAAEIAAIHRLILTDGSYQQVRRWEIKDDRVRFISAERNGVWEELPVGMVDWAATEKFAHAHTDAGREETEASDDARAVDAEAAAEKAEITSRTPQVVPRLNLPNRDGVWVLDYFQNQPELVTLLQDSGDVNQRTGHNVQRGQINPPPNRKAEVRLDGDGSKIHLHENQPVFYVSLTGGDDSAGPDAITVSAPGVKVGGDDVSSPQSQYAIVELDSRRGYRVITNVTLNELGRQSENVTQTTTTVLPGRHWMKVVPKQKLTVGQYALMELMGPREANLSVWDFAIDPQSGDNLNAILPIDR
ncbi:MAG TPA: hypothetical protein VHZ25_19520 [Acidobacteriaceae bacterium]|nr:hypothetical protein [Acidobacteriaceae bacterium]